MRSRNTRNQIIWYCKLGFCFLKMKGQIHLELDRLWVWGWFQKGKKKMRCVRRCLASCVSKGLSWQHNVSRKGQHSPSLSRVASEIWLQLYRLRSVSFVQDSAIFIIEASVMLSLLVTPSIVRLGRYLAMALTASSVSKVNLWRFKVVKLLRYCTIFVTAASVMRCDVKRPKWVIIAQRCET